MRHLLGGVALAALLAAGLPAAAQTNGTQPQTPPAASNQSGTSQSAAATDEPATKAKNKHAGKNKSMAAAHKRGGMAAEDNMAEELNRQELAKVEQGSSPGQGSGSTATPAQPAPASGMAPKQ